MDSRQASSPPSVVAYQDEPTSAETPPSDVPTSGITFHTWDQRHGLVPPERYMALGSLNLSDTKKVKHVYESWTDFDLDESSQNDHPPKHPLLELVEILIRARWARATIRTYRKPCYRNTVRVYILPDDVGRQYLTRHDKKNRKALIALLRGIDRSAKSWSGLADEQQKAEKYLPRARDDDSLFYIFNTLKSPSPNSAKITDKYANRTANDILQKGKIPGLRTGLYPYQSRSIATMIQREVQPVRRLDPRLETFTSPVNQIFYYDPQIGLLLSEKREYDEPRGGILAETMGFGKTLICLSVILATKGHWPQVPPEYSVGLDAVRPSTASLLQTCAATTGKLRIPWAPVFDKLSADGDSYENCIRALVENVGSYVVPSLEPRRNVRTKIAHKGERISLCSATLVIVPPNLVAQWRDEINAHLEESAVSVLVLDSLNAPIPSAAELARYDIILITKARFEREISTGEIALSVRQDSKCCTAQINEGCNCVSDDVHVSPTVPQSPLEKLHFLRIIVDEGHNFVSSGSDGNAIRVLQRLRVERRWIISGTPAQGLLGLEVATAAHETSNDSFSTERERRHRILKERRTEFAFKQEYKDLERLGHIAVKFLQMKPFSNLRTGEDPAAWSQYVMPSKSGERKANSLRHTLESLVVRHRNEDIEADLQLPPLHNRIVQLVPSYHDKICINLFLLVLIVNAVTSERADQDYMFHPKNRRQLDQLINNLRQSGFFWTGFTARDISEPLRVGREYLVKNTGPTAARGDLALLEEALNVGKEALDSGSWRMFSEIHEIGLYVAGFPDDARDTWALHPMEQSEVMLIGATQLRLAQQYVNTHLYASDPAAGLPAAGIVAMEAARRNASASGAETSDTIVVNTKTSPIQGGMALHSSTKETTKGFDKQVTSRIRATPKTPEKSNLQPPIEPVPSGPNGLKSVLKSSVPTPISFPISSPLLKTQLRGTASAKLSYLLDRIASLHTMEKILVFYEGDYIAFYISQALDVINVPHLMYARHINTIRRNAYITTFNTSSHFRVMLMELHQAAHGLHVASASRVFFVNPVWQPNIEAQAIKRAHRIGQTRPVYVETLVLKDTLENKMMERRKAMTTHEHQQAQKSLIDDSTMSDIIKNAHFLKISQYERDHTLGQVAMLNIPQQVFLQRERIFDTDDPDAGLIFPEFDDANSSARVKPRQRSAFATKADDEASNSVVMDPMKKRKVGRHFESSGGILMSATKKNRCMSNKITRFGTDETR
ncbi:hypothetical protein MMC09_005826 [Bachmanniomyces sp. S44760]|nr:hypothetical protein [Bachmanniomyces sp. S44760]